MIAEIPDAMEDAVPTAGTSAFLAKLGDVVLEVAPSPAWGWTARRVPSAAALRGRASMSAYRDGQLVYLSAPHQLLRDSDRVDIGPRRGDGIPLAGSDGVPRVPLALLANIARRLVKLNCWTTLTLRSRATDIETHRVARDQVALVLPRPIVCIAAGPIVCTPGEQDVTNAIAGAELALPLADAWRLLGALQDAIDGHKRRRRDLEREYPCNEDDAERWGVPVGTRARESVDGEVWVREPPRRHSDAITWIPVRDRRNPGAALEDRRLDWSRICREVDR